MIVISFLGLFRTTQQRRLSDNKYPGRTTFPISLTSLDSLNRQADPVVATVIQVILTDL